MRNKLLLTPIFVFAFLFLRAQPVSTVRTFGVHDGLPTNSITAIRQGPSGLIWIATWNGVCCYDGNRITTFHGEPWGSDNALSSHRISAIGPDSQGNVWVRTYDEGLYLLDGHQCRYINVGLLLQKKYGVDFHPRNIYVLPNGHTWINDNDGMLNLRIDDRYASNIDSIEIWGGKGHPIKGTRIHKVEMDAHGREWIVTDLGMMSYRNHEFRKGVYDLDEIRRAPHDTISRHAEQYVRQNDIGKHFIDRQGNLWYTNAQGLSLVNFKNSNMRLLPLVESVDVRSVCCRRDGSVWAGSHDGCIGIYNANGQQQGWLGPQGQCVSKKEHFAHSVYALYEDHDGNMWIGTKGEGVFVVQGGHSVRHYQHDKSNPYSLGHNDVYDFDQDEQGHLWIATYGGGVNMVDNTTGKDLRFIHSGNEFNGYPKNAFNKVRRITHDGRGTVLASTTTGLLTFSSKDVHSRRLHFFTTCHDPKDTTSLQTSDVAQVLVTKTGTGYVVTMGGGIQRITSSQLQRDHLHLERVYAMNQGEGSALSLLEDNQGHIWIVREAEVNRYHVKSGRLEQFGPNSMSENANLTEALPAIHPNGSIWLGANGGVLTFLPLDMHKSQYQPQLVFTGIQYQGEQTLQPILTQPGLDITHREHRSFTISFAALDFENDYLIQYAYRLKTSGHESEKWNYIGHHPRISFSELPPGKHTLVIKSTNADGVWCDNEASFTIYVQPTLLERTWFQVLLLLLVIGLSTWGLITYLSYRRKSKEREQRLENIMRQYRELQEQLVKPTPTVTKYHLEEPEIADPDEEFMNRLMAYIEQRISDETLRIEDMAEAVGMGRTVFYGKVKELVGVSPSDFLKQVRMQRAQQLVAKSKTTFSEIAYSVGFTDPKYFTKCFKKLTGMTPSEYREKTSAASSS